MPIPPEPITSMTAYFPIFCIRGSELFKPLRGYLHWTWLDCRAAIDFPTPNALLWRGCCRIHTVNGRHSTSNHGNASVLSRSLLFAWGKPSRTPRSFGTHLAAMKSRRRATLPPLPLVDASDQRGYSAPQRASVTLAIAQLSECKPLRMALGSGLTMRASLQRLEGADQTP